LISQGLAAQRKGLIDLADQDDFFGTCAKGIARAGEGAEDVNDDNSAGCPCALRQRKTLKLHD
jgi:hypothetical protein